MFCTIISTLFTFNEAIGIGLLFAFIVFWLFSLAKKRKTLVIWLIFLLCIIVGCELTEIFYTKHNRGFEIYRLIIDGIAVSSFMGLLFALAFGQKLMKELWHRD